MSLSVEYIIPIAHVIRDISISIIIRNVYLDNPISSSTTISRYFVESKRRTESRRLLAVTCAASCCDRLRSLVGCNPLLTVAFYASCDACLSVDKRPQATQAIASGSRRLGEATACDACAAAPGGERAHWS